MSHFFGSADGGGKKRKADETADASDAADKSSKPRVGEGGNQLSRAEISRAVALMLAKTRKVRERVYEARQKGDQPKLRDLVACEFWHKALEDQFSKKYFENLEAFVHAEWRAKVEVFPDPWNVFRALNACPPSKVKVVILGQDPYHNVGQAMGLSFSVPTGVKVPSSLRNIYKELASDVEGVRVPNHGNLERWTAQGVMLLNAVLTVRAHQANSHQKKGWEAFTEEVIKTISARGDHVVFLLWGRQAQDRGRLIRNQARHLILKCAHPSGLSAHRGFFGSKHFSKCNDFLKSHGLAPIDWSL